MDRSCGKRESITWGQRRKKHPTYNKRNWINRILQTNYLIQHVIEGKINGTWRRGRRYDQLLEDRKETKTTENWKVALSEDIKMEEAMDLYYDILHDDRMTTFIT